MKTKSSVWSIKIRKRSWYVWMWRIVWLIWLIFWADVTLGSWQEMEPRAFTISLAIFFFSLFLGLVLWLIGYLRYKKAKA